MNNHYGCVKTKQQMADEFGICRKTFNKLLVRKNIKLDRGLISPKDQMIIYNELGIPALVEKLHFAPKVSR